jgi:hypothetical protein
MFVMLFTCVVVVQAKTNTWSWDCIWVGNVVCLNKIQIKKFEVPFYVSYYYIGFNFSNKFWWEYFECTQLVIRLGIQIFICIIFLNRGWKPRALLMVL